jgi:hypothetical protein
MAPIRERLDALAKALGLQRPLLQRARRRYRTFHGRAYKAMKQKEVAMAAADEARSYGEVVKGQRLDRKALRYEHIEVKNRARKVFWRGRVKVLNRRVKGLEDDRSKVEAEIAAWKKDHGVQIKGNRSSGGSPWKRWMTVGLIAVANCASGKRRNFYSQSGGWSIRHELEPGPAYGDRSDCSSTVTGLAWSADLPDPNGQRFGGGYTATLMSKSSGWREVSEAQMKAAKKPGFIVYVTSWSDEIGHHTEGYAPSAANPDRTVGHGDSRVDFGTVDDFGDGLFRCFIFDPKESK